MENAPLTDEEIQIVQTHWKRDSDSYLEMALTRDEMCSYWQRLQDHRVVEIGPGENPINNHFPCKEYISANGCFPNDGLSVLRRQRNKSAVVVSFGVLDNFVLGRSINNPNSLVLRYIAEMVDHIKRVMHPFAVIVGCDAQSYMGVPDISVTDADPAWVTDGGIYLRK